MALLGTQPTAGKEAEVIPPVIIITIISVEPVLTATIYLTETFAFINISSTTRPRRKSGTRRSARLQCTLEMLVSSWWKAWTWSQCSSQWSTAYGLPQSVRLANLWTPLRIAKFQSTSFSQSTKVGATKDLLRWKAGQIRSLRVISLSGDLAPFVMTTILRSSGKPSWCCTRSVTSISSLWIP